MPVLLVCQCSAELREVGVSFYLFCPGVAYGLGIGQWEGAEQMHGDSGTQLRP